MKTKLAVLTLTAASALLTLTVPAPAQSAYAPPASYGGGGPTVLTTEQAQARTKAQMQAAMVQTIGMLERQFDNLCNLVTGNPYHLTTEQVVAGFGPELDAKVRSGGARLLSTAIKSNLDLGRDDPWLKQAWVQQWIAAYRLDPATGDPLPAATQ